LLLLSGVGLVAACLLGCFLRGEAARAT